MTNLLEARARCASLAASVALTAACAVPLRGASHHHPVEIYERLAPSKSYSTPPSLARLDKPLVIVAQAWGDRVLAPTGLSLDDWQSEKVSETYLTPHLTHHLYLVGVGKLRAAGAEVRRSYGPYQGQSDPALRVLEVDILHAELHRWVQKNLFGQGRGTVDLVRVDYAFRWSEGGGLQTNAGQGRVELLLPPDGDDLDAVGQALVAELLTQLR